mgnify:CR=1 FL=1
MADTTTTTYGLVKPEIGASEDTWGAKYHTTVDALDDLLDGTTAIAPNLVGWKISGTAVTATASQINLGLAAVTQSEAEAGTKTTGLMTPLRTAQAIAVLGAGSQVTYQEFLSSGTWTKPADIKFVFVEAIGGGGGGANNTGSTVADGGIGGGGGGFADGLILASLAGSTETVTIAAGGVGGANGALAAGSNGGATSFGSLLSSAGGKSGLNTGAYGGGGERGGYVKGTPEVTQIKGTGGYSSGGGGMAQGGNCVRGGAGGGGGGGATGGVSQSAGNGGAGSFFSNTQGGGGSVPGGGGGGSTNDGGGGNGAAGRVRVWAW